MQLDAQNMEEEPSLMGTSTTVPMMFGSLITYQLLSLFFVCLRLYGKRMAKAPWYVDDYVLIFSWFLEFAYVFIVLWLAGFAGKGVPFEYLVTQDLDYLKDELPTLLRLTPVMAMIGTVGTVAPKLSFLLTLLRLVVKPCQRQALWVSITLSTVTAIPLIFLPFFICELGFFEEGSGVCISPKVVFGYTGFACAVQIFMAEVSATIIAACVPFCRPLVKKLTSRQQANKESCGSEGSTSPCRPYGPVPMGRVKVYYHEKAQKKAARHVRLGSLGESQSDGKTDEDYGGGYSPGTAV